MFRPLFTAASVESASLHAEDEADALGADMTLHNPVDLDHMVRCARKYDAGAAVAKWQVY